MKFLILLFLSLTSFGNSFAGTVELHAHLFMKQGMAWMFRGNFEDPIQATTWRDRFSSQANAETLDRSGNEIVVVALYAHPLLLATAFTSVKDSIRSQVQHARAFVATHPNWIIARDAPEAEAAISRGKKVLILALEGASQTLDTEEDLREFIDQDGIRIVTFLHLTDDELGGVAFLRGWRALSDPWAWIKTMFHDGVRENPSGLTAQGKWLANRLLDRGVWIDLAHSSDVSQSELIPLIEARHEPLLYTHTVLRRYHQAERGISDSQLVEVARTHGILGLIPSEEMLEGTPHVGGCPTGLGQLAKQYEEVATVLGSDSIMFGSDFNGGLPHLAPGCLPGSRLNGVGLLSIGETPDVWKGLKNLGAPVPEPLEKTVDHFLATWKQIVHTK